jgi:hypothetical protein
MEGRYQNAPNCGLAMENYGKRTTHAAFRRPNQHPIPRQEASHGSPRRPTSRPFVRNQLS